MKLTIIISLILYSVSAYAGGNSMGFGNKSLNRGSDNRRMGDESGGGGKTLAKVQIGEIIIS